mgnify:CR=1 FL=1
MANLCLSSTTNAGRVVILFFSAFLLVRGTSKLIS